MEEKIKVLFASSECSPFVKVGGLADVVGSLPKCFDKRYFDCRVILPKYQCMKEEFKNKLEYITHFYMDIGNKKICKRCLLRDMAEADYKKIEDVIFNREYETGVNFITNF